MSDSVARRRPGNDQILYLGANTPSAGREATALAGGAAVHVIAPAAGDVLEGYDLATDGGRRAFVTTFELPSEVAHVLADVPAGERAAIAQIAAAWAPGESGGIAPSRLVLSGHSTGVSVWGPEAEVHFDAVIALAHAMPGAASQVEDLHFSACSTVAQASLTSAREAWRDAFPNLATIWTYAGAAPLAPIAHLTRWEAATTGRAYDLPPVGDVATWSAHGGFVDRDGPIATLRRNVTAADARFTAFFTGETSIHDPSSPNALADQRAYRALAGRDEATPGEREIATARADFLVRLRYYEVSVRGELAKAHGEAIESAFAEAGVTIDVARASRAEMLNAIAAFADARPTSSLRSLIQGIRDLDDDTIPDAWIHH